MQPITTAGKAVAPSWTRAYWLLALLWALVAFPTAFLAASTLEGAFSDLRLVGSRAYFPLLTQWYQTLGGSEIYTLSAVPGLLFLVLAPFRARSFAVWPLGLAVFANLYLAFGGVVAAHIAYVKLCN